jgi:hypothetical protein
MHPRGATPIACSNNPFFDNDLLLTESPPRGVIGTPCRILKPTLMASSASRSAAAATFSSRTQCALTPAPATPSHVSPSHHPCLCDPQPPSLTWTAPAWPPSGRRGTGEVQPTSMPAARAQTLQTASVRRRWGPHAGQQPACRRSRRWLRPAERRLLLQTIRRAAKRLCGQEV